MAQPTKKDDKKLHAGTLTVKSDGSKQSNPPPTNELLETFCFEFDREPDSYEKKNVLRTLEEISVDQPLAPPNESVKRWEERAQRAKGSDGAAGSFTPQPFPTTGRAVFRIRRLNLRELCLCGR